MDAQPAVVRKIDAFLAQWPTAGFGFAHVVLSDFNLEDYWIETALEHAVANDEHSAQEVEATSAFLRELLQISEDERTGWYADAEVTQ